ncbi:hypothetical protein [Jannaschia ovalis]|uniref:Uncharacterized protein n=1 Tax=Jannaschia ovalis TaxID=3038773 RepID=A0ABY8LCN3_9RHOB|nr:hypothetical protein [Jannaschia sp. GRR-S6-38]WGH78045.1 hypothetical protein P8627_13540 [Jannaschia sp. GRR-S6-38]
MTAEPNEIRDRILAFAANVGGATNAPEAKARRRGWLDDKGEPTADGRKLIDSLGDQDGTRTVFRGL